MNYLQWFHRNGFVFSTPDFFVMGRAVPRTANPKEILDQTNLFLNEKRDCWYIFAAAGNTQRMWRVVPWELPWFCWTRIADSHSELTFVESDRLRRLCPPDVNSIADES